MNTQKIDAQSVAQTQGKVLPKLTPSADFSLKTKFALANAFANSSYTPEEGEAALKESIGRALGQKSFVQDRIESLKKDYQYVKNPIDAAVVTFGRVASGTQKIGTEIADSWQMAPTSVKIAGGVVAAGAAIAATGGLAAPAVAGAASTGGFLGALTGGQAVATVAGLVGASVLGSCDKALPGEEHNHFETLPTDTVDKFYEVIVEKPVPGPVVHDTLFTTIRDTITLPGTVDTIFKTRVDTFIKEIQLPPIVLPPVIITVKEGFQSEIPEKVKEMAFDLGIDTAGIGTYLYGIDYQDEKNNKIHRSLWDGGRTSRDGDVYVMNEIKTGWDDPAENYIFGKNEQFQRNELYLSGNRDLTNCPNTPKSGINVSNGNGVPNWFIFEPGQPTAEPGNWVRNNPSSFTKVRDGEWQSSDGFTYKKGEKPGEIKKYNAHGAEWNFRNVSLIGGEDAHSPQ